MSWYKKLLTWLGDGILPTPEPANTFAVDCDHCRTTFFILETDPMPNCPACGKYPVDLDDLDY